MHISHSCVPLGVQSQFIALGTASFFHLGILTSSKGLQIILCQKASHWSSLVFYGWNMTLVYGLTLCEINVYPSLSVLCINHWVQLHVPNEVYLDVHVSLRFCLVGDRGALLSDSVPELTQCRLSLKGKGQQGGRQCWHPSQCSQQLPKLTAKETLCWALL